MRNGQTKTTRQASRLWGVVLLVALLTGIAAAQDAGASALQPQGLNRVGTYALRELAPELTGQGVRFGIICRSVTYENDKPQNDYQPNIDHACFGAANLRLQGDRRETVGVSAHSTAICSILFGEDVEATDPDLGSFLYQGAVPAAEGHIYEYLDFGEKYVFTQKAPPVDVITASFGFQFENWWTRALESLIEHEGIPVVASVGNGTNASDPPLYPGASSNTIGVGVVSSVNTGDPATDLTHFSLAYPERSTLGPTDDGRCKPDLIAPGNCLVATADGQRDYTMSGDWSSFATPVTAGVVGLLVQAAQQDDALAAALAPQGGNCVLKAVLMSSATKLPFWHKGRLSTEDDGEAPLDLVQGAGMVNAVGAYRLLKAGQVFPGDVPSAGWDLNLLDATEGLPHVYRMTVDEPAGKMVTATLSWNRHYRREYPFDRIKSLDSNLKIEFVAIDPEDPSKDLLLDTCDSKVDNVEHIHWSLLAEYQVYELRVSYSDAENAAPSSMTERYALAWSVAADPGMDNILWYDLNVDGIVDEADIAVFLENRNLGLTSPDAYVIGDLKPDGVFDGRDMERLLENRNRTADWRAAAVAN